MSIRQQDDYRRRPSVSKTFVLPVGGSTVLHVSGASAPSGIDWLPSSMQLVVATTGTFIWTDQLGNSNTVTYPTGVFDLPFIAGTLSVGTAIGSVTVSWNL